MSLRCKHAMLMGLCVVAGCPHWDGVGKGAKAQAKSIKRTCARCPNMTTKVHCTACSRTEAVLQERRQHRRMQQEGA